MGGHGDAGMRPVAVIGGQRFGAKHIQRGMADMPGVKRRQQRVVVDQGAAPGVDQRRAARHPAQCPRVDQVGGRGGVGQQGDDDLRLVQNPPQPFIAVVAGDFSVLLRASAPAQNREAQTRQRASAGNAQRAQAQHRHRAFRSQGGSFGHPASLPGGIGARGMQMGAQHMADHVFHHALRQTRIDHAAQRLGQCPVAGDLLDPGPQVLHQLALHIRREIGNRPTTGRVDDGIHIARFRLLHQFRRHARPRQSRLQGLLPVRPARRAGVEQNRRHARSRGRWMQADCTSPKPISTVNIAEPP